MRLLRTLFYFQIRLLVGRLICKLRTYHCYVEGYIPPHLHLSKHYKYWICTTCRNETEQDPCQAVKDAFNTVKQEAVKRAESRADTLNVYAGQR